ncbi:DoxX family membrane protein [Actinomadura sp. KC216]|uniref:DoxX family membrane protein n=1 Tax=Actinomadura sp. KC216 TaxID=2530370 RepID=UPI00104DD6E9|nr:DoxX family membrane protein [Actinomadura sp. KC216]TDB88180.1 DoxX family membrane protein [Actinomadura sp. KC216]
MSLDTRLRSSLSLTAEHPARYALAAGRIFLGWIFLWAFLDKLFGIKKGTESGWLSGTSPSKGFLSHNDGPFKEVFHSMAGQVWVDALFMFGLGGLGVALLLGICLRLAALGGTILMFMLWVASLWPDTNPFMDMHWIYAALLIAIALADAGTTLGLGRPWARLVRNSALLR